MDIPLYAIILVAIAAVVLTVFVWPRLNETGRMIIYVVVAILCLWVIVKYLPLILAG